MITNCNIAIEEKQEPPKKSKRKSKKTSKEATKKEMNRSFFIVLPRKLIFVILPFF